MKSSGKLILICGLPGSGKSTLAKKIEESLGAFRLCADDWMDALSLDLFDETRRRKIEALQWGFAQDLLNHAQTVIIEWGSWERSERDEMRLRAVELGATVELHYLSAKMEVLFERIQRRGKENPPIKWEFLVNWFKRFQEPSPEEMVLYTHAQKYEQV